MRRALDQRQALDLLRQRPEMLERLVTPNSKSWFIARTAHAEYVKVPEFWLHDPTRVDEILSSETAVPSGAERAGRSLIAILLDSVAPPR